MTEMKWTMSIGMERRINESYRHIKPYLKQIDILKDMCSHCEKYCGEEHDYNECLGTPCFTCYLGYEYLKWQSSYEDNGGY